MKVDIMLIIQLIMICLCVASIFTYLNVIYRKVIKSFNDKAVEGIFVQALKYIIKLSSKDYIVYEKYRIWQYCVYF